MKKYTTKIHVQRLKKMLKRKDLEMCCPANQGFCSGPKYDYEDLKMWNLENGYPCDICTSFIGLSVEDRCPCDMLGPQKAREITEQKIKEWEEENEMR